jgi:hypothetical protein
VSPLPTPRDIAFQTAYVADLERDLENRTEHLDKERRILAAMTKDRRTNARP